ncbi:PIN domain-containing protein [Ascidiaceihabitans sp.]|uniref:RSP_2648 family PIN domain-containing protein n=1 Tax=Ascidiaceihabitans sp. TaxID=1872644 RepID=UPI0032996B5F
MIVFLDACVLFPTVMREMIVGAANSGAFQIQYSPRVLEEWARAARRLGDMGEMQARAEIALLRSAFPKAEVTPKQGLDRRLWLPDDNDIHVLAAAITGSADAIMTSNTKDFPKHILADEGLDRVDPDGFLVRIQQTHPEAMADVGARVLHQARQMPGPDWSIRTLMKKARLPRLGKALS